MNDRVDRCETCRFWDGGDEEERRVCESPEDWYGSCERYPKRVLQRYPVDWCGEWKPAREPGNVITISYLG